MIAVVAILIACAGLIWGVNQARTPSTLWMGDFESNGFSTLKDYFENRNAPAPALVGSPVAQGSRSAKFEAPPASYRNEALMNGVLTNGTTRYFGWSLHLPSNLTTSSAWRILAQWRHNGKSGSPPVCLKIEKGLWRVDGGWIPSGSDVNEKSAIKRIELGSVSADRGKYVRWVFGIKFAVGDPAQGWVSVWKNGVQLANQVAWRTMYRQHDGKPFTSSLKFGIYRDTSIKTTDIVYYDNWKMGTTYASVAN